IREQNQGLNEALEALERTRKEHGGLAGALNKTKDGFNTNTEAGYDLEEAYDALAEKTDRAMQAAVDSGASQEELKEIYQRGVDDLDELADKAGIETPEALAKMRDQVGINESALGRYSDQIKKVPDKVSTKVETPGL